MLLKRTVKGDWSIIVSELTYSRYLCCCGYVYRRDNGGVGKGKCIGWHYIRSEAIIGTVRLHILPDPVQLVPIIYDIQVECSTFLTDIYSQGIIQNTNSVNVSISGNYIATNSSMPLIWICNSRNITAHNNTVINTQTTIHTYYTYDTTNPCRRNLTSLIDLPPSAFNS
jgi:hypothetical protein